MFEDNYVNNAAPLNVTAAHYTQNQDGSISANLTLRRGSRMIQCGAAGNGRLDAVANAIEQAAGMDFTLIHYSEHALDPDTDSRACSYVAEVARWQRDLGLRHPHRHHRCRYPRAGQCNQ